jgi:hypothetical protein
MIFLTGLFNRLHLLVHYLSQSELLLVNLLILKRLYKSLLLLDLLILLKQGLSFFFDHLISGLDLFMLSSAGFVHVLLHFLELLFFVDQEHYIFLKLCKFEL